MVSTWIFYCTSNNLSVFWDVLLQMAVTLREYSNWKYRWIIWLISNPLWMEQRRSLIRLSGFGFFGFQIQWILFQNGFIRSKIRIWICERNAKSVLRSKIRFWIQRKELTLNCEWRCIGVRYAKCSLTNCTTAMVSLQRIAIPLF